MEGGFWREVAFNLLASCRNREADRRDPNPNLRGRSLNIESCIRRSTKAVSKSELPRREGMNYY